MVYLDVGSIGGLVKDVLHDFQPVEEVAAGRRFPPAFTALFFCFNVDV